MFAAINDWRYNTVRIDSLWPNGDKDQGRHRLRLWLVAWRHQAITWTNVDVSSVRPSGIHLMTISLEEIPRPPIDKTGLKITNLKFHSNIPGRNELNWVSWGVLFWVVLRTLTFIKNPSELLMYHHVETFFALLVLCKGNHRSTADTPHNGPVMRIFNLLFTWTNSEQSVIWDATTLMWRHCSALQTPYIHSPPNTEPRFVKLIPCIRCSTLWWHLSTLLM